MFKFNNYICLHKIKTAIMFITLTLGIEDITVLKKALKVAKARKKLEARHHLKKGFEDNWKVKSDFVNQIDQLEHYLHYLTK